MSCPPLWLPFLKTKSWIIISCQSSAVQWKQDTALRLNKSKYHEYLLLLIGQTMPSSELKYYMFSCSNKLCLYIVNIYVIVIYVQYSWIPPRNVSHSSSCLMTTCSTAKGSPSSSSTLQSPHLSSVSINYLVLPGMQVSQDTARPEFLYNCTTL